MWENSVERRFWRNIILAVLCIAAIISLVFVLNISREKKAAETADLTQVSSQRKIEQEASVNETLKAIEALYRQDVAVVETYLPGIVCWGDTLTRGTSGNVSYPDVLQSYINSEICNKYDFSKSIEGSVVYSGLAKTDYTIRIPVVNMGGGNENSATILARANTIDFLVGSRFTIPEDTAPVEFALSSELSGSVNPLTVGDQGINPVMIDGISGTITVSSTYKTNHYFFTRSEPGEKHQVEAGTTVVCSNAGIYSDYIHVIWLGAYDYIKYPADYLSMCETLLSRQVKNTDRFIIIGPCSISNTWNCRTDILDQIDADMLAKYGDHYINLRKYLMTDALSDAELKPTEDDSSEIQRGRVPISLRSGDDSIELSSKAYELVGKLVYERMNRLGYFAEVCTKLKISK